MYSVVSPYHLSLIIPKNRFVLGHELSFLCFTCFWNAFPVSVRSSHSLSHFVLGLRFTIVKELIDRGLSLPSLLSVSALYHLFIPLAFQTMGSINELRTKTLHGLEGIQERL